MTHKNTMFFIQSIIHHGPKNDREESVVIIFENNNLHHGPENSKKGLHYGNGNTYHSLEKK
jgi:hypothetical protein